MIISPCVLLVPAATDKKSMSHLHKHKLTRTLHAHSLKRTHTQSCLLRKHSTLFAHFDKSKLGKSVFYCYIIFLGNINIIVRDRCWKQKTNASCYDRPGIGSCDWSVFFNSLSAHTNIYSTHYSLTVLPICFK